MPQFGKLFESQITGAPEDFKWGKWHARFRCLPQCSDDKAQKIAYKESVQKCGRENYRDLSYLDS